jgi:hypothetical protein
MKKIRKTHIEIILQTNYGNGWEDECECESTKEAVELRNDYFREYRMYGFSGVGSRFFDARIIRRRVVDE